MEWVSTQVELPPSGQTVEVRHELSSPSYNTTGHINPDGEWSCRNGFVYPIGRQAVLTFTPTHWRPVEEPQP